MIMKSHLMIMFLVHLLACNFPNNLPDTKASNRNYSLWMDDLFTSHWQSLLNCVTSLILHPSESDRRDDIMDIMKLFKRAIMKIKYHHLSCKWNSDFWCAYDHLQVWDKVQQNQEKLFYDLFFSFLSHSSTFGVKYEMITSDPVNKCTQVSKISF